MNSIRISEKLRDMETILKIADIMLPLPEDKQQEILDFAEFIFQKYTDTINGNEPSAELKKMLLSRLKQHRENPELAKNWNDLKEELLHG